MNINSEYEKANLTELYDYDVLVIDDNITIIQLLTYYFENMSLNCKCVRTGSITIEELQK